MTQTFPAITELVPHQAPLLALEEVTSWELGQARGKLTIRDSNPFVHQGELNTVMSLEYMAQCVAACLGMEAYISGVNVRVGMVIACRKMEISQPVLRVGGLATFHATAREKGVDRSRPGSYVTTAPTYATLASAASSSSNCLALARQTRRLSR